MLLSQLFPRKFNFKLLRSLSTRIDVIDGQEFEVPYNYVPPKYDFDSLQNESNVLLMRHANSKFNLKYMEIENEYGYKNEIKQLFLNEDYRDSELSDFGIAQWLHASKYMNKLDIDTVVVSPLKRTMETAYHSLKAHKDFLNI